MTFPETSPESVDGVPTSSKPEAEIGRRRSLRHRNKTYDWIVILIVAIIVAVLIRTYLLEAFYIPSASMNNTLVKGDRVLVDKLAYNIGSIHRGDIIVFSKPDTPGAKLYYNEEDIHDLIKRVIALPGDTIESRKVSSDSPVTAIFVNGVQLHEKYIKPGSDAGRDISKQVIPDGTLYVLGDNRASSEDSRYVGPIPEKDVVGKAFMIMWPFGSVKFL